MTKAKKSKGNHKVQTIKSPPPPKKVWHIFRFKERFELPEDMKIHRRSGLQYTRDFVSAAGGDEAVGYLNQFGMLSNGDGEELSMLRGLYRSLVNMAAQHSRAKRGYLLDASAEPLTDGQIAKLLNYKAARMRQLLARFARVKLLEKVPLPEFDFALNETQKKDNNQGALNSSENSGNFRAPLKKRQTTKAPNGAKQKTTSGLTASGKKENNDNGIDQSKRGDQSLESQDQAQGYGQAESRTTASPTTSPPLSSMPQESDDGGRVVLFTRSPGSADYSRAGLSYGRRVYLALGYKWDIDSPKAAREIGSFASKHDQVLIVMAGVPPPALDGVLARGLREAGKIAKRKTNRNKGAVWNTVMDKLAAARRREAM